MVYAIGTLDGYAFLVQRGDTGVFDMHRLVHLATRIWIGREGRTSQAEREATGHVSTIFPSPDYQNQHQWREYMPHALRLLQGDNTVELAKRYNLCNKVGLCFRVDGQIKDAVRYLEESCHWRRDRLPPDDASRLESQYTLAVIYLENGQIEEAITLLKEVIKIQKQTLKVDHLDRLASQHNLAGAYQANGQFEEAVTLLKEVIKIKEQTLKVNHPSRLMSQEQLATVYWDLGQREAALQLMEHVVEVRKEVLAEDHPYRKNSEEWLEYFRNELANS
ncbi:hypothetical protein PV08_10596 [Exophiala spinifera]|uniref:Uncharacterized protein n=1 Tax=Exophiala spinifera TaxID=91928 RepID=A0A0D1Y8H3_9EURO|nr:uncharacterized protein PV08_10596 [Exophiala spinifera]KIW11296.1 hypothetical protein PV08_10596 [Exophiala spinifera]